MALNFDDVGIRLSAWGQEFFWVHIYFGFRQYVHICNEVPWGQESNVIMTVICFLDNLGIYTPEGNYMHFSHASIFWLCIVTLSHMEISTGSAHRSSSTLDFQYWGLDKDLHSAHPAAALLVASMCLCSEGPP